jgi:putative ABC transport system permease protein
MSFLTLLLRNLRFHARAHLGTALGAAVGSAVLVGALIVGDSVRGSLRNIALSRLGNVHLALASEDRFFRVALATNLAQSLNTAVVPGMQVQATAARSDGTARANAVQLLGVTPHFWELSRAPDLIPQLEPGTVALNERLARHLGVQSGDTILLRMARPSMLSREAPLAPQQNSTLASRVAVRTVVDDDQMGRFSLRASQIPPFNAYVSLDWLQHQLELPAKANLLLVADGDHPITAPIANQTLRTLWQLPDAELEIREIPGQNTLEIRTPRVFLDPTLTSLHLAPGAQRFLTYFVNELRAGTRATPYSMVTATDAPPVPTDLDDDEIIINDWLARDLAIGPGHQLDLSFFVIGLGRTLEERSASFRVHSVVPLTGPAADPELMPKFPGVEQAESTRDWDPSLPVDLSRIRAQDEQYWADHRGTPKAFISLNAGRALWQNRFGDLTAIRYPMPEGANTLAHTIESNLRQQLDPSSVGLRFEPVRQLALNAVSEAQDFGGLFLGFSFFLIAAALLLMALLFQFGIEQRSIETGTLLALGFTPRHTRRLLLLEGCFVALLGTLPGLAGGILYAQLMLKGLSTLWRDAVGTASLHFYAEPLTLLSGALSATLLAWLIIGLTLRKLTRLSARELLAESAATREDRLTPTAASPVRRYRTCIIFTFLALSLLFYAMTRGDSVSPVVFFGAGTLWLLAGLSLAAAWLLVIAVSKNSTHLSIVTMAARNASRRRKRSLAILALLASGSFLIASIGVFRLESIRDVHQRSSGTGGFALVGESTMPIVHDLNSQTGREFYALDAADLEGVQFVPLRVRDGDDASCLNLNRAQQPRLLGVHPEQLADRGAFTFARLAHGATNLSPWLLLQRQTPNETSSSVPPVIPAIGDLNSILWAMGKKVGDTLAYTDERGREFHVRIVGAVANSILQGNLLIDETAFSQRFPSEPGYRMFLIDAPDDRIANVAAALSRALGDAGLELTPSADRLDQFNAVQNTYLGTFQILGGLGLILGSVGLGVVVLRNVFERRAELALLVAVGYRVRSLKRLVLLEHVSLLLAGLALGLLAGLVAVLPNLLSPRRAHSLPLAWHHPRRNPAQRRPLDVGRHGDCPAQSTHPKPPQRIKSLTSYNFPALRQRYSVVG